MERTQTKGKTKMSYMHIENLYKNQEILSFRECYSLEKIHGTSAHISLKKNNEDVEVGYFSGGASYEQFVKLFDEQHLKEVFYTFNQESAIIYGEAYGGKMQGMSKTYGTTLKFIAFDYFSNDWWYTVPAAEHFVKELGLEFVDYTLVPTDVDVLNNERDKESTQAIRNGMGNGHLREGVVLRPLFEYRQRKEGGRIIVKHKADKFKETKTPRDIIVDPQYLKVLEDAKLIADEWVTVMRLQHILDKLPNAGLEQMRQVLDLMVDDIEREGKGEIIIGKETRGTICKSTAGLFKKHLKERIGIK